METVGRNTFGAPAPRDNLQVEPGFRGWLVNFAFEAAADCLLLLIMGFHI